MTIGWLDPSLGTLNAGDLIISDAIGKELQELADVDLLRLSTRRPWTAEERSRARSACLFIVGGTNLLTSHPAKYRQWVIGSRDAAVLRHRTILMGVGWWQYQARPDPLSRLMLSWTLHPTALQGVRDSYTADRLRHLDGRVVNISCPTLWQVQRDGKAEHQFNEVIVSTVTDYNQDTGRDRVMLRTLSERSRELLIWPQGSGDISYVTDLGFGSNLIRGGLTALDRALDRPSAGYVGTRLHAGIRALQHGVPTVVIAIDNRTTELGSDVGLWIHDRGQMHSLDRYLDERSTWRLMLPDGDIARWRSSLQRSLVNS